MIRRTSLLGLALFLVTYLTSAQESAIDGHWVGAIEIPGQALDIDVDFSSDGEVLRGDISIPAQGIQDMELIEVLLSGASISFVIPGIPGDPTFAGTLAEDNANIAGRFTQAEAALDFALSRGASPAAAARSALEGFNDFVGQAIDDWNVPGTAMAMIVGGEVVFAEGFGWRDIDGELPMTADTLFAIGSTTKAFTTTLLGTMVDEGLLEWDAPLSRYLPEFRLADPVVTQLLTPRDLVTHRSGLPRHDLVWYNNTESTREEVVARMAHLELSEPLRAKFQYNNLMFMTAGYLAGRLVDSTWEEALRQRLLEPLGMSRTNFSVRDSQADEDYSQPYREDDDTQTIEQIPFRDIGLIGPAGSLNSSINEMAKWLLFNLNGGRVGDEQLVNAATLSDIHTPHMTTGATADRPEISPAAYGLGWGIDTYRGHRRVTHGGGIDGFITSVMLFPDDGIGLVSFVNRGSGLPVLLNQHAVDLVLGLDPIDWSDEALAERLQGLEAQKEAEEKKEELRIAGTEPSHALEDYAGEYVHPGYGTLLVSREEESLSVVYNGIKAPLLHWHYDVWNGAESEADDPTFEDVKFQFRGNVEGLIGSVEAALEARADPIAFSRQPDSRLSDPVYLARYVGKYELTGQVATIALAGSTLTVSLPGQPLYSLEPEITGRFALSELPTFKVGFVDDASGAVTSLTFIQPNGVFEAKRVE